MNSLLVLRGLKQALKKRKITYKELGQKLGLTEAAIKKQFQAGDISFNRINMICDILGISVNALLAEAANKPIQKLALNKVQEKFFISNPKMFIFFLNLSKENGNAEKANEDMKMNSAALWKSLKSLEDINLIKLHTQGRVELIYGSLLSIPAQSLAVEKISNQLAKDFLDRHLGVPSAAKDFKLSLLKLSKKNAEQLKLELSRLYEYYLRQSEIDAYSLEPKEISTYSLLLASGEFSFI